MAKAVVARQHGDEYQQLVFWKYALKMLSGSYDIENIKYEDEKVKSYDDVDVVKIGDFGLVKVPDSTLTSLQSELKGSLNDPDLVNVGFGNYEMYHETFALTRLCYFVLTGRTNIEKQKNDAIKSFWNKGTSPAREKRYQSVDELYSAIQKI